MAQLSGTYWLPVEWPAPINVKAVYTTRHAIKKDSATRVTGIDRSDSPFVGNFLNVDDSIQKERVANSDDFGDFNLALHVNDNPKRVQRNRDYLQRSLRLPSQPFWLEQVHSSRCVELTEQPSDLTTETVADASYTRLKEAACCVMTADCLPVLICNRQGNWVAAVHAGWRGLADGVIENTIARYTGDLSDLLAWLGPAISQSCFEVGSEVKEKFVGQYEPFASAFKANQENKFMADLYQIARMKLQTKGVKVFGGNFCTFQDEQHFYSYRRNNQTGRMASLVWIE